MECPCNYSLDANMYVHAAVYRDDYAVLRLYYECGGKCASSPARTALAASWQSAHLAPYVGWGGVEMMTLKRLHADCICETVASVLCFNLVFG